MAAACVTVSENVPAEDWLLSSPLYEIVMVWAPAAAGVTWISAEPLLSVTVPRGVEPSSKVTVPVGTPVPGLLTLTVASSVTGWPKKGEAGDSIRPIVVLLPAGVTVMAFVVSEPAKLLSERLRVKSVPGSLRVRFVEGGEAVRDRCGEWCRPGLHQMSSDPV